MAQDDGNRRMTGRTGGIPQVSARSSALQELLNLKRKGGKRTDHFEVRLEENICETLSEADYDLHVAKRREEAAAFVVDDEGLGYIDGEDDDGWDAKDESGGTTKQKKAGETMKNEGPSRKAVELAAAAALTGKRRVTSMFAAAPNNTFGRRARDNQIGANKVGTSTESILDDVLAGITASDVDRERENRRRRGLRTAENARTGFCRARQSLWQSALPSDSRPPNVHDVSPPQDEAQRSELHHLLSSGSPVNEIVDCTREDSAPDVLCPEIGGEAVRTEDTMVPPTVQCSAEHQSVPLTSEPVEEFKEPSVIDGCSMAKIEISESKCGVNAKIAERSKVGEEASAAWYSICEGGVQKKVPNAPKEEAIDESLKSACISLPIDADGKLPFYLIDAYEEEFGANPGTIYLFGKVLTGSKGDYVSCCVVVQNLQRCLYAVPAPSIFSDNSLSELEEASKSGGDVAKLALNSKLQELARDMKMELAEKLMDLNVGRFTMAPVKRSYAFEKPNVPVGENYFMKISYPFKDAPLPSNLCGVHFTCLFGTYTSAMELFLVKRKIKGPCWLSISNPICCSSSSQVSWCKIEINLRSPKDLVVMPGGKGPVQIPQLVVAAINLKTVLSQKGNVNEVASASVVYSTHVKIDTPMPLAEWNTHEMLSHFSIVRKLDGGIFPVGFTLEAAQINSKMGSTVLCHESSERALLNHLMVKLHQLDPDILVGHNISGFDLDVLLHRLQACKVQSKIWSKIGRLRRSQMPRLGGSGNTIGSGAGPGHIACLAGRLLCDTYLSSRELLRETSYSLTELSRTQLGKERKELFPFEIPTMYQSSSTLIELVESGETDAWLALGLMFHLSVLPLTRQLTNISGNLWSRTLQGSRAQRVEYLLLHEFHGRKFIVPDKLSLREKERLTNKRKPEAQQALDKDSDDTLIDDRVAAVDEQTTSGKRKKGPAYLGGLVLEPKKGLYDKFILLLDFNSLYPSIIQEYNICFTTVYRPPDGSIPHLPSTDSPGVLPQVLKALVDRRKQVKMWLKSTMDNLKYQQFDIQQQALKLTANSIYGCLGFTNARFYAKPMAELITFQGREILQNTVDLVKTSLNLEVIYGDTDSLMIHTGLEDLSAARMIGWRVIKEVNKKYKLLEIDLDGIYKRMLLLKKKKYAAVKIEVNGDGSLREVIEQKGLDIVRRDWSLLSKDIGNFVLKQILSGGSREDVVESIHNELRKLQEDMRNGQVALDKYIINKTLTKPPEDYPDAKGQPHVQIALRRRQAGYHVGCSAGDTVPYIICVEQGSTGITSSGIADRAKHPDELKMDNAGWIVDIEYYISQQIRPVVTRLCAPIEGTDPRRIAECLGLDPSKFPQAQVTNNHEEALLLSGTILDDDHRYRQCEPLQLVCPQCIQSYTFLGVSNILADCTTEAGDVEADREPFSDDPLRCPRCPGEGSLQRLSPAMLANQVKQRAEEFVARYYHGVMLCDEDSCGHMTRNVSLRIVGDAEKGTVCPNYPRCTGRLGRQYTEVDLYKQLTHFYRLLDTSRALEKIVQLTDQMAAERRMATFLAAFDTAAQAIKDLRDRSGFRWVQLGTLCVSAW